jgi:hypothetical protein
MAEALTNFRVVFKGKRSQQVMTLQARNKDEARQLAERAQFRRHERFPLTFDRLNASLESGDLSKEMHKAQVQLRKRDQGRYDDGELKVVKVEEVK